MSTRIDTMSNSFSSPSRLPDFFRKLVSVLAFVIGMVVFIALLNLYQTNLSPLWMTIFAILSIGLASGSALRMVFYEWSRFIRFLALIIILPLGLFLLGLLTAWEMGIGPLEPWLRKVIDTEQLIQLGGALLVAIICLEAWWRPRPRIEAISDARETSNHREQVPTAISMQASAQPRSSRVQPQPKRSWRPKFMRAGNSRATKIPAAKSMFARPAQPVRSSRRQLFKRKPKLQFSVFEEHRCPYCLDLVKRNDPRGVKECEVCHSLHHADCWAITGQCQVPHLNS